MVDVARRNYPERTGRNGKVIPASYECRYLYEGREIAWYDSKTDCLYLRTDCIGCDFKKSVYDRAVSCKFQDGYKYLFDMLGADKTARMSEYT